MTQQFLRNLSGLVEYCCPVACKRSFYVPKGSPGMFPDSYNDDMLTCPWCDSPCYPREEHNPKDLEGIVR